MLKGHKPNEPIAERLAQYISPEPMSGCWLWTGTVDYKGYGKLHVKCGVRFAHRISYELFVGLIPAGLQLDHLCRVRCCVNPDHLEVVTNKENCRRGNTGLHMAIKTHCPAGHEYTPENTNIYLGRRSCRACHRIRKRA